MATLIPSLSTCLRKMTPGEKRFAQRLESKLENDYYCWYDVPIGPKRLHPDFIILHPQRGLVILEVKDWKPDNIVSITPCEATILTDTGPTIGKNPLEQARDYAHAVADLLKTDPQLIGNNGKLLFPWTYGVVMTNVSRKVFEQGNLADVLPEHRVICQDEMVESVDPLAFQERLWEMFTIGNREMLSMPQIARIRWNLFPDIRLNYRQSSLFETESEHSVEIPDIVQVMDLQQEQLARSLGDGHRVIHGVAGSGKTLILGYRAQQLAKVCAKPILVLCFNKIFARRLQEMMDSKGIADKILVCHFHAWCRTLLITYNMELPPNGPEEGDYSEELVQRVIRGVDQKMIPAGQYDAILVDEGHDFRPEWLKVVVQMVNPRTNSLLVMYDDAQDIYGTKNGRTFSFKSVGIQATGRTTVLKVNYRNTQEILDYAASFARNLLTAQEAEEDGIPRIAPFSAGRRGAKPVRIKLPTLPDEAAYTVNILKDAHAKGTPWRDMAVLYDHWTPTGQALSTALYEARIPQVGKDKIQFNSGLDKVALLTFEGSKGLEFPLVVIPQGKHPGNPSDEEAKRLYVAMTRATSQLFITEQQEDQGAPH
jgi:hypothetical protein